MSELIYPGQEQYLRGVIDKQIIAYSQALLGLANEKVPHLEMAEFPLRDEWSILMRQAIENLASIGTFDDRLLLGLGIGDGRNERLAAMQNKVSGVVGVDVDSAKLALAWHNLLLLPQFSKDGETEENTLQLHAGDVVEFLQKQNENGTVWHNPFAFICLPQAKPDDGHGTVSDVVTKQLAHRPYDARWGKYGLTLNAATLDALKTSSKSDQLDALLVLSGRIRPDVRERLISETGWVSKGVVTNGIVRQDPDTPLSWMKDLTAEDDGQRFFKDREGKAPLSIAKALTLHSQQHPIFHEVFVHHISPNSHL